jgi:hypothetical protein
VRWDVETVQVSLRQKKEAQAKIRRMTKNVTVTILQGTKIEPDRPHPKKEVVPSKLDFSFRQ